ncbi:MAG: hypothetical protein GXP28_00335 [Planctomycetes bacterium]|nr:hypothetical protein [Planctomycetota bacterium]
MTLLIVFLATGNIAIGYALAVYLGHGQLPWRLGSAMVPRPVASPSSREELDEPEELVTPDEEISEAFEVPAIEQVLEEETAPTEENPEVPIEEVVSDRLEAVEDPVEVARVDEAADVGEEVVEEVEEVEEVEATVETEEEEIAASDEKIPEPPAIEASVEDSDQQAGTEEKLDEKFLEGIAAFQSQLEQSEEKSAKESAEEVESETAQDEAAPSEEPIANPVETATDAQEESSISDDVLAGIESFRAQLANMQQKSGEEESDSDSETSEKESAEQPVG